eukprot:5900090-Alexandrium_andersonii.AAC.1
MDCPGALAAPALRRRGGSPLSTSPPESSKAPASLRAVSASADQTRQAASTPSCLARRQARPLTLR